MQVTINRGHCDGSTVLQGKPGEVLQVIHAMNKQANKQQAINRRAQQAAVPGRIDWQAVKAICQSGRAAEMLPVGTVLTAQHKTLGGICWRVCKATAHHIWLVATRPVCNFTFDACEREENSESKPLPNSGRQYGYNCWCESAIRQWLNSESCAGNWWEPANPWDAEPDEHRETEGFLVGFDRDFVAALASTDVVTANAEGKADTTSDRMFLLSRTEVFGGENNGVAEGCKLDLGNGFCKDLPYWLRSPLPGIANHVYIVTTSGSLNLNYAYNAFGVAPACVI